MEGTTADSSPLRRAVAMIVFVAVLAGGAGLTAAAGDGPDSSVRLSPDDRIAGNIDVDDIIVPGFTVPDPPVVATIPPEDLIPVLPPRPPIGIGDLIAPSGECPGGEPIVDITAFHVRRADALFGPDQYDVVVEGVVHNETSARMAVWSVSVTIDSEPAQEVQAFPDDGGLDPGETSSWRVDARVQSTRPPAAAKTRPSWTRTEPGAQLC